MDHIKSVLQGQYGTRVQPAQLGQAVPARSGTGTMGDSDSDKLRRCGRCGGMGFTRDYTQGPDAPGFGRLVACECATARTSARLILQRKADANIPAGLAAKTFQNLAMRTGLEEAVAAAKALAAGVLHERFLLLYGPVGTGKTHLGVAALHAWNANSKPGPGGVYMRCAAALEEIKAAFDTGNPQAVMRRYREAGLLLMDDIGAHYTRSRRGPGAAWEQDWADSVLNEMIDYRYTEGLRTIFTSNVPAEAFPTRTRDRVCDVGTRFSKVIFLDLGSYREGGC